jgi:hypothetical protein
MNAEDKTRNDMESLVKSYVQNVDQGNYEAALNLISIHKQEESIFDPYNLDPLFLKGYKDIGGIHGENIEIKDLTINHVSTTRMSNSDMFDGEITWSCKVYVNGKIRQQYYIGTPKDDSIYTFNCFQGEDKFTCEQLYVGNSESAIFDVLINPSN